MTISEKIVIPGGAGLVGQNLVARLVAKGYTNIVVLDKHEANLNVLRHCQPAVVGEYADVSEPGGWQQHFENASAVVMLQAQIGGIDYQLFERNNVDSTRHILSAMRMHAVPYLIHVSSSVVESIADDFYTQSKTAQEQIVMASGVPCVILRPTLMFGWFDRKHLGWLSRFMQRTPIFPVPGNGRFMRQPLYAGDFCNIIVRCLERKTQGGPYNISGHERVDYIDIIKEIKRVTQSRTPILNIPYGVFHALLWLWACIDRDPPFTTQQLKALVAKDEFEVIDWPGMFDVPCTPFAKAMEETFQHPRYSHIELEF